MLSFEEARATILKTVSPLDTEQVSLLEAMGRVAAEEVIATLNLPRFDNSSMDGYAVRMEDSAQFGSLRVQGYIPAGAVPTSEVPPGCAVRIMTGAPIPEGCEAIVPFEETEEMGETIRLCKAITLGQHIRRAGEDIRSGTVALTHGSAICVPEVSLLASLGRTSVHVHRRPRVAILATGDELVEPGYPLASGQLFNSNSLALAAGVQECGAIPLLLGIARDDRESLQEKLQEGLRADVLITAAGVSVGDRDLVRETLLDLGMHQEFWGIAMKPGKSTAFGKVGNVPVFSLPGNPVSSIVTFEELVRPALLKMLGHRQVIRPYLRAVLQEKVRKLPGKTQLLRVRLEVHHGELMAWSAGDQDTRFLRTLLNADGLAILPPERNDYDAGEMVCVHLLSGRAGVIGPDHGTETPSEKKEARR